MTKNKFDLLDMENGMIAETNDGTYYVFIDGVFYNFSSNGHRYDYIVINRDGTCDKFSGGKKNIKSVFIMNTCPKANRLSEAMKKASGQGSKYTLNVVFQSEDPRVAEARNRLDKAKRDYLDAQKDYVRLTDSSI